MRSKLGLTLALAAILSLFGWAAAMAAASDPAAHYPLDANGTESTGNYAAGVLGGPIVPTATADRNGVDAGALLFGAGVPAGTNNGGHVDLGTALNFPTWPQYTVSVWFRHDGGGGINTQKILDKTWYFQDWYLGVVPYNGRPIWNTYSGGGGGIYPDIFVMDGAWHQLTVTRSGADGEMWIDGELLGTADNIKTPTNSRRLMIGYSDAGDGNQRYYFNGAIDDLRIYDVVLTPDQLATELIDAVFTEDSVAASAAAKTASIASAPNDKARAGKLGAFNRFLRAQTGKTISAADAALLSNLAANL